MSAAATLDAWLWPPNLAAECATQTGRAGGLSVRYPKSDHHLARLLISSLATSSKGLADIPARDLASILGAAGERVAAGLDERIVMAIAANAGLTAPMAGVVARGMAESWTTESLMRLLHAEFPDPAVLDGFVADGPTADAPTADSPTAVTAREVTAAAPGVTLHIGAGSVPGVTVASMIRALMVKSPVLAKPGAGDIVLTRLFARELHRADDRLRHAVAMQYWPGGDPGHDGWEREVLTRAGQVVVYGGDDTIESVRARTPATTRLIEHPNRLGVAIVDPRSAPDADGHAARAVALFDQKGCVSTHLILLLGALDDPLAPEHAVQWCGRLAASLEALSGTLPPATASPGELSARHQLRGRLAIRHAGSADIRSWSCPAGTWTVVLGRPDSFEPVGGRTAWVVPVPDLSRCLEILRPLRRVLQSVGVAGLGARRRAFGQAISAVGATRIVPLDQVPFPDPDWLHDGSRPLGELVRWTELR